MSKVEAVRPRYIAFRIHAARPFPRRALQEALQRGAREAGIPEGQAPHLTRYEFPHAIVRTEHDVAAAVRDLLGRTASVADAGSRLAVRLEPLSTSGTLAALTERLGLLRERADAGEHRDAPPRRTQHPRTKPARQG